MKKNNNLIIINFCYINLEIKFSIIFYNYLILVNKLKTRKINLYKFYNFLKIFFYIFGKN